MIKIGFVSHKFPHFLKNSRKPLHPDRGGSEAMTIEALPMKSQVVYFLGFLRLSRMYIDLE
jgi:hypothetical protein